MGTARVASAGSAGASLPPPRRGLPDAVGWTLIVLLTLGVLATWAPSLDSGLGDNHEGRILARHALNVANAQRDGLVASSWLRDWSPYVGAGGEQTSYGHHPPLLNLGYYATAVLLPVDDDVAMRVFAYLMGAAMLPIGAAALRRLRLGWPATVVATAVVAVTPLFWVYGRLHGNVTLALALALMLIRLQERRPVGRGELALTVVIATLAITGGYLGMATAALLGLWLLARRGLDRVTLTVGIAMTVAAAVSIGYVLAGTGADRIAAQVELRTAGGDFTAAEFLARIGTWITALLPGWWRWIVLPVALVAGLVDRRTRVPTLLLAVLTIGYVGGLPNGAFIHDYWVFPLLLPVWFGAAAAVERITTPPGPHVRADLLGTLVGAGLLVLVLGAGAWSGLRGEIPATYITGPEQAGTLVRALGPAPDQAVAWHGPGIPAPRWLSYYWQLPPGELDGPPPAALDDATRVLLRVDRLEGIVPALPAGATRAGDYAVVTVGELRRTAGAGG